MPKRVKVAVTVEPDILIALEDLHKQATVERSHYYVGKCCRDAIEEIKTLRAEIDRLRKWSPDDLRF